MLRPASSGASVVVCSTCRQSPDRRENQAGRRGGAALAAAIEELQRTEPRYANIAVDQMPCLFACSRHCTVHIRAAGKIGYVLGDFLPDADSARAILDYALHHAASEHGQVPYADWPQGVKGHFIVRIPPEGSIVE